ncbi:hypothetical protein CLV84_0256 [Neolewinella xylanilytica]|uniref:SusE-like outer membrane protein n=1 Tax=Neolewinella xylanilytica TaxID=1514080 RepID=A0A2S6I766_9BACT|nr:SusF/SusE family outer membrane protein [Neolewinella xylanilytica]PPK87318.1 hypothetical protein CLV84_0256 [Neolewinella xylanilytica]
MHNPKQLLNWLVLSLLLVLVACDREEIDIAANTDFPPAILSSTPSANGRVVAGNFDVRVVFADGSISPLQSGTVTLMDSLMTEIATATEDLEGLQDSIVIEGSTFGAADLALGIYNMTVTVTDTKGQTTESSFSFEISNLPYPANYDEIYLAGDFNTWTDDSLTLVADHIWEIRNVDLDGGGWKLKSSLSWDEENWGDGDCDGFLNSSLAAGGNANTECGFSGLVHLRFNDESLAYSVTPAVTFASQTMGLYLLGTFNNFQGSEYQFTLVEDNSWELAEILLKPGAQFKIAEMPDFVGTNYGDNNNDGVAQVGGSNITYADTLQAAYYSITFNDRSLAYELEFLRNERPESIGLIGTAVTGGWTPANGDFDLRYDEGSDTWTAVVGLVAGEFKFRANDDWELSWGGGAFPSGTASSDNDDNLTATAGIYVVTFDASTGEYTFEPASVGLLGSATSTGWDADIDMTPNPDVAGEVTLTTMLTNSADNPGAVKFRVNDDWPYNWGGTEFPTGTAVFNSPDNIPVPTTGEYTVTFNVNTLEYSFE